MKVTTKHIIFYGGVFSQWFECSFKDKEGTVFSNAEQFMMYHKARFFKDYDILKKIMRESNPREVKALGRQVRNFKEESWNKVSKKIVTLGNYYKFSQDEKLKKDMLANPTKKFVEASPYDRIWGVGLSTTDPKADNPENWNGTNWLGDCLDDARVIVDNDNNESIVELLESIVYKEIP